MRNNKFLDKDYWKNLLKMGMTRFLIFKVLESRGPLHCYMIAKTINRITDEACSPSEESLYPILREMLEGGYVTCKPVEVKGRVRKIYTLTKKGYNAFYKALEVWEEMHTVLTTVKKTEASEIKQLG